MYCLRIFYFKRSRYFLKQNQHYKYKESDIKDYITMKKSDYKYEYVYQINFTEVKILFKE